MTGIQVSNESGVRNTRCAAEELMNSGLGPRYAGFVELDRQNSRLRLGEIALAPLLVVCLAALVTTGCSKARKDAIGVLNKGVVALDQGAPNSAYDFFLEASHIDPSFAEAFYHLGLVQYHERQELHAARDSLHQAVTLEPTHKDALYQLGRLSYELNDYTNSQKFLRSALDQDIELAGAHYFLGLVADETGDLKEADVRFRDAIIYDPHLNAAYSSLGRLYERVGAEDAAAQVYKEAIRLNPTDVDNRKLLAGIMARRGRGEDAVELLTRAFEYGPGDAETLFSLANAHLMAGNDIAAQALLERYVSRPANGDITPPKNIHVAQVVLDNLRRKAEIRKQEEQEKRSAETPETATPSGP